MQREWPADLVRPWSLRGATATEGYFLSGPEHSSGLQVLSAETEFREERDSHQSRSGGVTPACRGYLPQAQVTQNYRQSKMMSRRRTNDLTRNSLDVRDRVQVRIVRKRLKISDAQLADIVRKAGTSISAISKEAGARQVLSLPKQIAGRP